MPYLKLKSTNVLATKEIIDVAMKYKIKRLIFISSIGVFSPLARNQLQPVSETESKLEEWKPFNLTGYGQSKWVADVLCCKIMQEYGDIFPITIIRPGTMWGAIETSDCNMEDFNSRFISLILSMRFYPSSDTVLEMIPIDLASQIIVHLSNVCRKNTWLKKSIFHLVNYQSPSLFQVASWINNQNLFHLEGKPFLEWKTLMKEFLVKNVNDELTNYHRVLTPYFEGNSFPKSNPNQFSQTQTLKALEELKNENLKSPSYEIDQKYVNLNIDYIIRFNGLSKI